MKMHAIFCKLISSLVLLGLLSAGCGQTDELTQTPYTEGSLRIHDVQGCAHISPYNSSEVRNLSGIVTWKVSNGFYMQDDQPDDQFCSSEAIFVFTQTFPDVMPGDRVMVSGRVDEYQPGGASENNLTITQIIEPEIRSISTGINLPDATLIGEGGINVPDNLIDDDDLEVFDPENDGIDFYESLESMLVMVNSGMVVGARNQFNEVVIVPEDQLKNNLISSSGSLIQTEDDANPERIMLNLNSENDDTVNVGDVLTGSVTGVLDYSYGNFKLNVFGVASFTGDKYVPTLNRDESEKLSIVTYNVKNLSQFDESRIRKLVDLISKTLNLPDIVVLHEIMDDSGVEDDGEVSAVILLETVTSQLQAKSGTDYAYLDNPPENDQDGGVTGGNIRSVILYRTDRVNLVETDQSRMSENPARIGSENWPFSVTRKPLVAMFEYEGDHVLIVAPHLTSRNADTPLYGIKQPIEKPEEEKRIAQAAYINDFLQDYHRNNPDVLIIVAGDLNDDPWSDTLETLCGDLLIDLGDTLPDYERFTYIHDGNAIQLDHILTYLPDDRQAAMQLLHINSLYDFSDQSSDHDVVIAEISLYDSSQ